MAWGDYDNDGRLDLALGSAIFRNTFPSNNTPPTPPANLQAIVAGDGATLSWSPGGDAETPVATLGYNLRVGTFPGAADVVSPQADLTSGVRRIPALGNANLALTARVERLDTGRTYYWSVQTIDGAFAGSAFAAEGSFFAPDPPSVTTLAATAISATGATLNGAANPNLAATTARFQWGPTPALGQLTPVVDLGSGSNDVPVSTVLTGLTHATTYYFQLVAENLAGVSTGHVLSFTTPAEPPSVTTLGPAVLATNRASVRGAVASNGLPTTAWFEYGLTTNLGLVTPPIPVGLTALAFNGSNQFAQAPGVAIGSQSFTVEFWMKRGRVNAPDFALFQGEAATSKGLRIGFLADNRFTFGFWNNDLNTTATYFDTDWQHWACTYDIAVNLRAIYRNGMLVNQAGASGGAYTGFGDLFIGFSPPDAAYLSGALDEVRIWSGARSAAQIAATMNTPLAGNEPGLLALWRLDEGVGNRAAGLGPQGGAASLSNAPAWVAGAPALSQHLPASTASVTAQLTNLTPNVACYYRLVASNALGTTAGSTLFVRPIDLAPVNAPVDVEGFNADLVLEMGGVALPVHDGSYGWFAAGTGGFSDGLPMGLSFTSGAANAGTHTRFQFAPANTNNALKLGDGFPLEGALTLAIPAAYETFSILGASGSGGGQGALRFHFAGGGTYTTTWNALDWCVGCGNRRELGVDAIEDFGRNAGLGAPPVGNLSGSGFAYERNNAFGLYETKIDLAAVGLATTRIEAVTFSRAAATSSFVFAMSGSLTPLALAVVQDPVSNSVCEGDAAAFSVMVDHPALAAYQWEKSPPGGAPFTPIPGATNATYLTPPLAVSDDGTAYRVIVAGPLNTVTSAPALVRVFPVVPDTPQVDFDFSALPAGSDLYGSAFHDATNGVVVLTGPAVNQAGSLIIDDPTPGTIVRGFSASFRVRITPGIEPAAHGFSFNWATNLPDGVWSDAEQGTGDGLIVGFDLAGPSVEVRWGGTVITNRSVDPGLLVTGNDEANVFIRLATNGTLDVYFDCLAIHENLPLPPIAASGLTGARFGFGARTGTGTATHVLDDVALQLTSAPIIPLAITQQPVSRGGCSGTTATFTVAVNDPPQVAGYQWQRRGVNDPDFTDLSGETNPSYTTPALTIDDDFATYRAIVTSFSGALTSQVAEIRLPSVVAPTVTYTLASAAPGTAIYGTAAYNSGSLRLVNQATGTGSLLVNDPAPGSLVRGFTASFQLALEIFFEGGNGFSFHWAPNLPDGGIGNTPVGSGLSFVINTLFGATSDAAGIGVYWNGTLISNTSIPLNGNLWQGEASFGDMVVRLNPDQTLDVLFRCQPVYTRLPLPSSPQVGARFGFGARTSWGLEDIWRIRNLSIEVDADPIPPPIIDAAAIGSADIPTFAFTNLPGTPFTVFAATNLIIPLHEWMLLGPAVENPPGSFQFSDPQATNHPQRFYNLRSP